MAHSYLACDLGAESGRLMSGILRDGIIELREIHRFQNVPIERDGSLHWNIEALYAELLNGLRKAGEEGIAYESFSCDSWGVDCVLFDSSGQIMQPVFHYRDPRFDRGVKTVFSKVSREQLFAQTGIQFMPINTVFQLGAEDPQRLKQARMLLGVADAFHFRLSGVARMEESMASTYQLYDPRTRDWSWPLIRQLGLPDSIFPEIVPSGTILGPICSASVPAASLSHANIIATCSHDTGTAVAAVPATGKRWAYLSSGTWSLLGVELDRPVITDRCRDLNFTNEIGFGGSVRLLKNIVGLWIVQECRRDWERSGHRYEYAELARLGAEAPAFRSLVFPNDARFVTPGGMIEKVREFCRESGQPVPESPGEIMRTVFESLALMYRCILEQVEELAGWKAERLHIVGGGSRNELLNQFTANAIGRPVLAGPVEATALGNVIIQALALGHLKNLEEGRAVVQRSFAAQEFLPQSADAWKQAYEKFLVLCS